MCVLVLPGGHIRVPRHPDDTVVGNCPYHGDCLEGLSNAAACAARCGVPPSELKHVPDEHPAWAMQAYYLAQLCATLTLLISPEVIVLGGGVLKRGHVLFPLVRAKTVELLAGYVQVDRIVGTRLLRARGWGLLCGVFIFFSLFPAQPDKYIVPSKFGPLAGVVGALELARLAGAGTATVSQE